MSAKRFLPVKVALLALRAVKQPTVMIVLLAISLIGSGCATTSQNAQYKPHKPQMLTSEGIEVIGASKFPYDWGHPFEMPDEVANVFEFLDHLIPRPQAGDPGISWR